MPKFKEIGENIEIFEPVSILNPQNIVLKNQIRISEFALIAGGLGTYIGNFVHIANHASIIGGGICILGDFTGICAGARIITGTDDVSGKGIPSPLVPNKYRSFYRSYVKCGKHVFIGTNAIIYPGVEIGDGAVIASGSVVTHDLEPWGVYVGQPAQRKKERNKEIIECYESQIYREMNIARSDFSDINYKIDSLTF